MKYFLFCLYKVMFSIKSIKLHVIKYTLNSQLLAYYNFPMAYPFRQLNYFQLLHIGKRLLSFNKCTFIQPWCKIRSHGRDLEC